MYVCMYVCMYVRVYMCILGSTHGVKTFFVGKWLHEVKSETREFTFHIELMPLLKTFSRQSWVNYMTDYKPSVLREKNTNFNSCSAKNIRI